MSIFELPTTMSSGTFDSSSFPSNDASLLHMKKAGHLHLWERAPYEPSFEGDDMFPIAGEDDEVTGEVIVGVFAGLDDAKFDSQTQLTSASKPDMGIPVQDTAVWDQAMAALDSSLEETCDATPAPGTHVVSSASVPTSSSSYIPLPLIAPVSETGEGPETSVPLTDDERSLLDAVSMCDIALVNALLREKLVDVNVRQHKTNYTPLMIAAENGSRLMCQTLMDLGADVSLTLQNKFCDDVVSLASAGGHEELAVLLLLRAIQLQHSEELESVEEAPSMAATEKLHYAFCDKQDEDGYTRAMNAAFREQAQLMKMLVQYGTNVNLVARNGQTLLRIIQGALQ